LRSITLTLTWWHDQPLVQPHGQYQSVVDGAEGDGRDRGTVRGEVEDVLVGVTIPEGDDTTLTTGAKEGRLATTALHTWGPP
jgi:hypothetical protein